MFGDNVSKFSVKLGDKYPDLFTSIFNEVDKVLSYDGMLDKISYNAEPSVNNIGTSTDTVKNTNHADRPKSAKKINTVYNLLTQEFGLRQGEDFLIFNERAVQRTRKGFPYNLFIVKDPLTVIIVCDRYADATRIKSYQDTSLEEVKEEVAYAFQKDELDSLGYTTHRMFNGAYNDQDTLNSHFNVLLRSYLVDVNTIRKSVSVSSTLITDDVINTPELIQLRTKLKIVFGDPFDVSLFTGKTITSLNINPSVMIGPSTFATKLGWPSTLDGRRVAYNSRKNFLRILGVYYSDCPQSLDLINDLLDTKAALRKIFGQPININLLNNRFILDLSNDKRLLGGSCWLATDLGLPSHVSDGSNNRIHYSTPKEFIKVLQVAYADYDDSLLLLNEHEKDLQLADSNLNRDLVSKEEIIVKLKKVLGKPIDLSKYTDDFVNSVKKITGMGSKTLAVYFGLPKKDSDTITRYNTPRRFLPVLERVYAGDQESLDLIAAYKK